MESDDEKPPRPNDSASRQPVEQPDYIDVGMRLIPILEALNDGFKDAFQLALRLCAEDSACEDHPHWLPRECWRSTQEFRKILYKAGQYEGRAAVRHLDRIPDPALRLFAHIEMVAALVGLPQIGGRSIYLTRPLGL